MFHFSVNVVPYSANLYLVSKLPSTLPESVFDDPPKQKIFHDVMMSLFKPNEQDEALSIVINVL